MLRVLRRDLWFGLALMAAGMFLLQATLTQWHLDDYFSIVTTKIGYSDFERRDPWQFQSDIAAALPGKNRTFVEFSYIKFDRKQNTRLWPFLFTGITRSPPASH